MTLVPALLPAPVTVASNRDVGVCIELPGGWRPCGAQTDRSIDADTMQLERTRRAEVGGHEWKFAVRARPVASVECWAYSRTTARMSCLRLLRAFGSRKIPRSRAIDAAVLFERP